MVILGGISDKCKNMQEPPALYLAINITYQIYYKSIDIVWLYVHSKSSISSAGRYIVVSFCHF
jgi:hypothetical protein